MVNIEKRVAQLVEEKIAGRPDLFLVDVKMHGGSKLVILVDGDNGVAIKDCAAISRHVGFCLEEENALQDAYNLEVSSPGLDAPLTSLRQYQKNLGRTLDIKLADNNKREGKLLQATDEGIVLSEVIKEKGLKAKEVENLIPFNQITESKVKISFK